MIRTFITSESGAATVEWVVLTAAMVGIGLAVMGVVSEGVENLAQEMSDFMTNFEIRTSFEEWEEFRQERAAQAAAAAEAEDPGS